MLLNTLIKKKKIKLFKVNLNDFFIFLNFDKEIFLEENKEKKKKWENVIKKDSFFLDTTFLIEIEDFIFLLVEEKNDREFLIQNYVLEKQENIKNEWEEEKNLIILSIEQLKTIKNKKQFSKEEEEALILFKNKELIKTSLTEYFI